MTALSLLLTFVIGLGVSCAFVRPRQAAAWLLALGCAFPAGFGFTSAVFFVARAAWPRQPMLPFVLDAAFAVASAALILRAARFFERPRALSRTELAAVALAMLAIASAAWSTATLVRAYPVGDWDAWAIWNLRAKFLAADGPALQQAWSQNLRETHPEYPLLLSASVARLWRYAGSDFTGAPQTIPVLLLFSSVAAGVAATALRRGVLLGALSTVVMLACAPLLAETATQYADVPLAAYFFLAVILFAAGESGLGAFFASLAAWTKDEGIVFAVAFVVAASIWRFRRAHAVAASAALVLLLTALFKAVLAERSAGAPAVSWTWRDDRVEPIVEAMRHGFTGLGEGWQHPTVPIIAMLLLLGVDRDRRRDAAFAALLAATMIVAYFAAYMTTGDDLRWRLSTSVGRLAIQVWPLIGLAGFLALRSPETLTKAQAVPPLKVKKSKRR
jgi:hypothetical protein